MTLHDFAAAVPSDLERPAASDTQREHALNHGDGGDHNAGVPVVAKDSERQPRGDARTTGALNGNGGGHTTNDAHGNLATVVPTDLPAAMTNPKPVVGAR